jgi:iron complex transport system substrate-binding protein
MLRIALRHLAPALLALALGASAAAAADTSRIVSVGGAVTEILYALGMEKNIVGIDTTSLYPPNAAAEKPSVGYMRALSAEGVLGLRPTLIIANEGTGPKETMTVLQAANVPTVIVPDSFSGAGILDKIRVVSEAAGQLQRGRCMADRVRADLGALDRLVASIPAKKRVMFVLSFVNGRAMVSGRKTAADGIIHMAGAINAVSEYEGYKPITDEAVIAAKPDVVLSMQRGGPNPVTADEVFAQASFGATPAAAGKKFVAMDGLYLLGFGPRTARAARDLAETLYPELKHEALPSEAASHNESCRE